jgi:hypothetical protein
MGRVVPSLRTVVLALVACCAPAAAQKQPPRAPATPMRVLFVGNSYLYTNDLPDAVERVAAARGVALVSGSLALPNYAIEDHLADGDYERRLAEGWDWVVLQQGPSSLPENQANLRIHSGRAANLARARGIRVALMSAWPHLDNVHTWSAAEASYRSAARANGLCVLPVASAWRLAREAAAALVLYDADRLHPARDGTLLAAQVIADGLLPRALPDGAPVLAAHFADGAWQASLARGPLIDTFARAALATEEPRCRLAK